MDQSGQESEDLLDQNLSAAIDNELNADECHELLEHLAEKTGYAEGVGAPPHDQRYAPW